MEQFLRVFINEQQNDWEELLPLAEFAYNNHSHSSTQDTPFMLDTGRHPRMGFEPRQRTSEIEAVNDFWNQMETRLEEAKAALGKAKAEYSHYYDHRRTPAPTLNPGDKVWLDASNIKTTRPSAKLAHQRLGPFTIEKQVGHRAYKLQLPIFPIVKLTLAPPDPIPERKTCPPPPLTLVHGVEEFDVDSILNSRFRYNHIEYLVKWKGFDIGENSWEPHYNLHCPRTNPAAPQHISATSFSSIPFNHNPPRPAQRTAAPAGDSHTETSRFEGGVM
jgi:hypothetical protein